MIELTDSAKEHIQKKLIEAGATATTTTHFRLSLKKTGCSGYMYVPEMVNEKKETDIEIDISGLLIYVDQDSAPLMEGTVIDYVKKSLGVSQLEFKNPKAESVCGCGESFKISVSVANK